MKSVYRGFIDVIANNAVLEKAIHGRFLTVLDNSSSSDLEWSIDGQSFEKIPKGLSVKLASDPVQEYFGTLFIKNTTGASVTIRYAVSSGEIYDSRATFTGTLSVNGTPDTNTTPAASAVTTSAAVIVAADSTTREVLIQNNGSNDLWIGDSTVDPANNRGIKILPGDAAIITSSGAIYGVTLTSTTTASIFRTSKS